MKSFKESIGSKRICVLGAGVAGTSAALFLLKKGAKVLISEKGILNPQRRSVLKRYGGMIEEGNHTDRIFSSDLIITSPGVPFKNPYINKAIEMGITVMDELELGWRFTESRLVAITGTNGKSTVTAWIGYILGNKCTICGNIGEPLTNCLNRSGIFVVEASSFQLSRTIDFRPNIAVFLNFDQDHLDWHPNLEDYWNSKIRIFRNQKKEDFSILNYDDPKIRRLKDELKGKVLFFSTEKEVLGSFVKNGTIYIHVNEKIPLLSIDEMKLKGHFNLQNALATTLVTYLLGCDWNEIKNGLVNFKGLPYRLEFFIEKNGIKFFNDSKSTNPHSLRAALQCFDTKVILIAGGINKGLDFTYLIPIIKDKVKSMIVFGKSKKKFVEIFKSHLLVIEVNQLENAVKEAYKLARNGDIILFSPGCSSFDLFKNYKERGEKFIDAVRKI